MGGRAQGMPSEAAFFPGYWDSADQVPSHTQVSVHWRMQQIQLVVDGSQTWSQKAHRHRAHRAQGLQPYTLVVGGLPASNHSSTLPVRNILPPCLAWPGQGLDVHPSRPSLTPTILFLQVSVGFSGCVKNLRLDKRPLRTPTRTVGVTPCVSGPLEDGLFFPGSEGVVTLGV